LYSTKYKSSSDSEEQMNVVHLDIVINTAYEQFSMKVYDIICESNLTEANPFSWLGLLKGGAKAVPRKFISAADKRAFEEASDELADIIAAKMKSGGLDHAPNIKDAERYIDSGLLAAKKSEGAEGEAWIQDMIYTAVKKAHERSTAAAKVGADAAKTGNTGGSLFLTGVKTAINTLLAYEIFSNVDEVFNNPKNGYMPVMRYWEDRLKSGAITQENFEEAHRETLKIAVGRLAFQTPTLLLGGALAVFKVLNLLRNGALTLIGFKKVAAGLNALGQFASYGAKSVLAGYLAFLNSDIPIMNADINSDGKKESLRPLDAIKWLIVDDAFYVVGKTAGVAAGLVGPLEQALILAYEDLIEKYGVDINTGLSKVGAKPLPSAVPGSKKSLGTSTPPAVAPTPAVAPSAPASSPSANTPSDEKFNPGDWTQTKSGFYQNNKTQAVISRQDYQKKIQSQ
jgi:hypothetical protein